LLGKISNTAEKRVVRGGSWNNNGRNLRSAMRNDNSPANRDKNLGLCLSLAQKAFEKCVNDQIFILFWVFRSSKNQGQYLASHVGGCRGKRQILVPPLGSFISWDYRNE